MSDQLRISWHDSTWIPHLNPVNVLDYFCQKSNPFYDKQCNNEVAKMQNLSPEQRLKMIGKEYILLHVQEPVLYIIRKQERLGPDSATPLEDYYVLAGVVYQAPDLNSILQSRVLNSALNLKSALEEFRGISCFNANTGHSWKFEQTSKTSKSTERTQRPDEFTKFQVKAGNLVKNFSENS